ncbi:MAG: hypothetical protein OEY93_04645 [Anaerolineae bacterium]|nr:hypothetical protein [Anaerolineae bacterium]
MTEFNEKQSGERFETVGSFIWVDGEGILHIIVKPKVVLTQQTIMEDIVIYEKVCADSPRPLLINLDNISQMDRSARSIASREMPRFASATAMVIGSPVSRVLGNLFLGFSRPAIPVQLFEDEVAALAWLRKFLA